jgi:hypothetical protein
MRRAFTLDESKTMRSSHVSRERLLSLMFEGGRLTREESDHIANWSCEVCKQVMLQAMQDYLEAEDDSAA